METQIGRGDIIMMAMRDDRIYDLSKEKLSIDEKNKIVIKKIVNLSKFSYDNPDVYYYNTLAEDIEKLIRIYKIYRVSNITISNIFNMNELIEMTTDIYHCIKMTNVFNISPTIVIIDHLDDNQKNDVIDFIQKYMLFLEFINMFIFLF